jgi:hypothetical protein
MNQDHASAPPAAETMLNTQAALTRPIAYDKVIAFNICDRFDNGRRWRSDQETKIISAKPATALGHARGLEKGFRYYQALEKQQMQAAKRRTVALRELERWNKGLGRRAREPSDRFIWAETICPTWPHKLHPGSLRRYIQALRA